MKKALILHFQNHRSEPRVRREISALLGRYEVSALGYEDGEMEGVRFFKIQKPRWNLKMRLIQRFWLLLRRFERVYWSLPQVKETAKVLQKERFDLIIAHDSETIPVALRYAQGAKVIANMHEYAPREFESYFWWKFYFAPYKAYLCATYLPKVDHCFTVSPGIAREYEENYGVKCDVIMSLPSALPLEPTTPANDTIRLIHHGVASMDRRIEGMIEMMDHVDSRFSLDLMLVPTNQSDYFQKLQAMAQSRPKVRIIPPVAFEEIVPFISRYDMGLYILAPSGFNTIHALPNKFFEFIQARLAIAVAPSPEMARIVEQEKLGIIAQDFKPQSMAKALNSLAPEALQCFKENAHKVAPLYSAEENGKRLRGIVSRVLGGES